MKHTSSPFPLNYSCISDEEENPDSASIFKLVLVHGGCINRNSIGFGLAHQRVFFSSGILPQSMQHLLERDERLLSQCCFSGSRKYHRAVMVDKGMCVH